MSIALGRVALDAGAKERVQLSKDIRAAVDRSLELDPNEDIAWHVLGRWNRKIATLSWVERNFANIFLGGVPKDASVERSVEYFEKAISIAPNVVVHWLELGISYKKLGLKDKASVAFEKVLELPIGDSDDAGHKAYAKKLLSEL
ncbi:MAG: tetratricopeptide repeat protein [Calditrichia bacterium]